MAAILIMDAVEFSARNSEECQRFMQELNDYVAYLLRDELRQHRLSPQTPSLAVLPTGDGMIICFLETKNPQGKRALDTAIKLQKWARGLKPKPFELRFGIHTGELWKVQDVNGLANVCGDAINIAQRIMDFGHADQIICSEEAFRAYYQSGYPTPPWHFDELHDFVGKHLVTLELRNVYKDKEDGDETFGNRNTPQRRWELEMEPVEGKVDEFLSKYKGAEELVFVGITNEVKVSSLATVLRNSLPAGFQWKSIRLLFLHPELFQYVLEDRATYERLKKAREALQTLRELMELQPLRDSGMTISCYWYDCFPYAGLSAIDVNVKSATGVIRFTPYFWGKRTQKSPGFVVRNTGGKPGDLYTLYLETLDHLQKHAQEFNLVDGLALLDKLLDQGNRRTPEKPSGTCVELGRDASKLITNMGLSYIEGTVTGPTGKQHAVRFLVDSGATYTLLPHQVWRDIELEPMESVQCVLADGTTVTRRVSECRLALPQGSRHTPVMLGEEGDEALLGAVTLEILGLIVNPFTRKLQPMRMRLA